MDASQIEKMKALALAADLRDLLDEEGENQAVRTFLMQYSCDRSITIGAMLDHMSMSGWRGTAPAFALECRPETHLTKAGAQIWLRHLFSLEGDDQLTQERDELRAEVERLKAELAAGAARQGGETKNSLWYIAAAKMANAHFHLSQYDKLPAHWRRTCREMVDEWDESRKEIGSGNAAIAAHSSK